MITTESLAPSYIAVIVAVPAATAVTVPDSIGKSQLSAGDTGLQTVATLSSLKEYLTPSR